jgi:hypothetical protein
MRPHSFGKTRWLLHWFEPDQETRWGELKSTPHHVNAIEDIFPHAWSILRAAGLAAPLRIHQVELMQPWSVRLTLMADDAIVEMIFDRHGTHRRRFLRLDTGDHTYELDFSEEPGIFLVDGVIAEAPPWNPEMRPLSLELSAFFATCAGGAMPNAPVAVSQSLEAVALMEDATKVFMELQARAVADAMCCAGPQLGPVRVLFDALCREAAMAGVRLSGSSEEGQALLAAAHAFVSGEDSAFVRPLSRFGAVAAHSSFLAQVRQRRKEILAGRDKACRNGGSRE